MDNIANSKAGRESSNFNDFNQKAKEIEVFEKLKPQNRISIDSPTVKNNNSYQNDVLHKNLYPNHAISLDKEPRESIQDVTGRYWLKSRNGNLITSSGKYDFVTMPNGKIIVSRGNVSDESTHLGLSSGNDVKYAGSIRFYDNQGNSRGTIKEWDNSSGHYKPSTENVNQAGLPLNKLVPNVRKVK